MFQGKLVAIILARGGSKGIPQKNIIDFCGSPLIWWTIQACLHELVSEVYVSSDSDEILDLSASMGANPIKRPANLSTDQSSSESGWIHAVEYLKLNPNDLIFAPQVTSPVRSKNDLHSHFSAVSSTRNRDMTFFSASPISDFYIWTRNADGCLKPLNYDVNNRGRRQEKECQYIETGSYYFFSAGSIIKFKNRFSDSVIPLETPFFSSFEIDDLDSLELNKLLFTEYCSSWEAF